MKKKTSKPKSKTKTSKKKSEQIDFKNSVQKIGKEILELPVLAQDYILKNPAHSKDVLRNIEDLSKAALPILKFIEQI